MPATVQKTHFSISALTVRVSSLPEKKPPYTKPSHRGFTRNTGLPKFLMALIQVNFYDGNCF